MMEQRIQFTRGDITAQDTEAIVNAANESLLGGGGVDGAIHRAAGPELLEECKHLDGCPTGEARITKGYQLKSQRVIHTVGPVWHGGQYGESDLLRSCYQNALQIASSEGIQSIAFPGISTGVYRFPKEKAAEIAIEEVRNFLKSHAVPEKVVFVLFDQENEEIYRTKLAYA